MGLWTTAYVDELPDANFAYVEPGEKDASGKTTPRSKRHLPYKGADGKPDAAHVRNALARLDQTQIPDAAKAEARSKLEHAAKETGVDVSKAIGGPVEWSTYLEITKRDDEQKMVYGYASTPTLDSQGDEVDTKALEAALPGYMRFANVREMHQKRAVGKTKHAEVNDAGLYVGVKVVDGEAWEKVKEGVLNGFSIGGAVTKREGKRITGLLLSEISLVDRPANPDAVFDCVKAFREEEQVDKEALEKIQAGFGELGGKLDQLVTALTKAAGGSGTPLKTEGDPGRTAAELEAAAKIEALEKQVSEFNASQRNSERKRVLDAGVAAGKIRAGERKQWEKDYDANPAMVERILKTMAPVVPMGERRGVGGDENEQSVSDRVVELVNKKQREIQELDKCDAPTAYERAVNWVFKTHRSEWDAYQQEQLQKTNPGMVMGQGFLAGGL